jgi:hypothetical protein
VCARITVHRRRHAGGIARRARVRAGQRRQAQRRWIRRVGDRRSHPPRTIGRCRPAPIIQGRATQPDRLPRTPRRQHRPDNA